MTRDAEIRFLQKDFRIEGWWYEPEYSQPARAMFQFHKEYSILVGRLESRDVLLANVNR
jgi:hypothetical protein